MTIFQRCIGKQLARSTVVVSTISTFLSCVSSYSPLTTQLSRSVSFSPSIAGCYVSYARIPKCCLISTSRQLTTRKSTTTSHFSSLNSPEEQEMTRDAMKIIKDAIQAVDPYTAIRSNLVRTDDTLSLKRGGEKFDLAKDYDEIVLVAFGKASSAMATSVLEQVYPKDRNGDRMEVPCRGVVICKDGHATPYEKEVLARHKVETYDASHPVPDDRSSEAADKLIQMVSSRASPRTLVLCCISGGGSALFCRPAPPLTLEDLQQVNSVLLASGMGIQEMNVLRKRLEEGKGGRLASSCFPSQVVSLILSDVIGDPLDLIASGPTVPDTSTWQDGWDIVQQYNLQDKLPKTVIETLQKGLDGTLEDSPSFNHPTFERVNNILVGNNAVAVGAASETAKRLGYQPVILGTEIEGEAKEIAKIYTAMASYLQKTLSQNSNKKELSAASAFTVAQSLPVALIGGGETTVSLTPNSGKGGRNQELALSAALELESLDLRNVVLTSVGTDGGDGPTDAAGAVVDAITIRDTRSKALDALATHNSYPYLESLKVPLEEVDNIPPPLIKTGPSGTNVADICVTLIRPSP
mmetsp:Transcript_16502/g.37904  ORF Transcript_16502/g.37904 Transcript_16502/m.37904 type:complete len:580 (-) Transcript_16502:2592-4331(-)